MNWSVALRTKSVSAIEALKSAKLFLSKQMSCTSDFEEDVVPTDELLSMYLAWERM